MKDWFYILYNCACRIRVIRKFNQVTGTEVTSNQFNVQKI